MQKKRCDYLASSALALSLIFLAPATGALADMGQPRFQGSAGTTSSGDNLGDHRALQALDMNSFRINNMADPTSMTDAVNVRFLQDALMANRDNLGNHTATQSLSMSGFEIINVRDPSSPTSVVNLRTLNDAISAAGGDNLGNHIATLDLNMSSRRVTNIANPINLDDAVNLRTLQNEISSLSGDDLGNHRAEMILDLSSFRIMNLADPVDGSDAVNLEFLENAISDALGSIPPPSGGGTSGIIAGSGISISGETISVNSTVVRTSGNQTIGGDKTFTGITSFNGQRVTNVANPASGTDAANRQWVVSMLGTIPSPVAYTGGTGITVSGSVISFDTVWGDGRYALRSRAISAGTGLLGGGNLQSNRTLSFDTAWGDGRYALRARTITAGDGLSGGGNLQSNRTINVDGTVVRTTNITQTIQGTKTFSGSLRSSLVTSGHTGTLILPGAVASGANRAGTLRTAALTANRTWRLPNESGAIVLDSRTITAGTGLTGGGTLRANRTVNLQNIQAGSTTQGTVWYNGTSRSGARFYGGTTNPNGTGRLNYNGYLYATRFYSSAYFHFSDERLKENIEDLDPRDVGARLMELRPVSYDWIENGEEAMGLIAQEVRTVFPGIVSEGEDGTLSVDYVQLISPMLAKMKDMDQSLEAERARNAELTSMLGEMEDRLAAIEALLRD